MHQLSEKYSVPTTLLAMRYLRVELLRQPAPENADDPNAPAQLLPECDAQMARLKAASEEYEMAETNRMVTNAALQRASKKNYKVLVQLAREMRTKLEGDQADPLFVRLFPKAPSKAVNSTSYTKTLRYTADVKARIEENPEDYPELQRYLPQMQENLEEIQKLLIRREQDLLAERKTKADRTAVLKEVQDFYNKAYIRLFKVYDGDQEQVDAFFYKLNKPSKKDAKKDEDSKE